MVDITLITGTTWPTPGDWNASDNDVHCIGGAGGGGGGGNGDCPDSSGGGAGGGG